MAIIPNKSVFGKLDNLSLKLGEANVKTKNDLLIVNTGVIERRWEWTGKGFVTVSLKQLDSDRQWANTNDLEYFCDWDLPEFIDNSSKAKLTKLTAKKSTDNDFTSEHIEILAEIKYPKSNLVLQYVIWVYPNSPGIRTQLRIKALKNFDAGSTSNISGRVDFVPVFSKNLKRRAIGYYNHTQKRNFHETEILKEEIFDKPLTNKEVFEWANIISVEDENGGLCLVKESHKCVNQTGINTGTFEFDKVGLRSTGWAVSPHDISTNKFSWCWASWCILYTGDNDNRQLAIKKFDRLRYPIKKDRDIYIMANTWGSTFNSADAMNAASEKNVLEEIKSQADLGIDVQQIDDGWQNPPPIRCVETKTWQPDKHKNRYPEGWKNVRKFAKNQNIKLGLWAMDIISLKNLKWNYNQGGFEFYKLDFIDIKNYSQLEKLIEKVRKFIEFANQKVRVNWDVTENPPRVGYFFAREFGNIYLENRKPNNEPVVYKPYLVLRDAWHVSKYLNLNKFQVTVQNIERVNPKKSDAHLHNHPYSVAIALMGSPIFFQETHYYTKQARKEIKKLLSLYKKHREEMYDCFVFPIGKEPDNKSWAGFQFHNSEKKSGYVTIFRELNNKETKKEICLKFLSNKKIKLTNLQTGKIINTKVSKDGNITFKIDNPADFRFFKYQKPRSSD